MHRYVSAMFASLVGVSAASAAGPITALTTPQGAITISDDSGKLLELAPVAWGPNWGWTGFQFTQKDENGAGVLSGKAKLGNGGPPIAYDITARLASPRQLAVDLVFTPEQAGNSTLVISGLEFSGRYTGKGIMQVTSAGQTTTRDYPFGREALGPSVTSIVAGKNADAIRITFAQPTEVAADGAARIVLGKEALTPQPRKVSLTIDLPSDVTFYASPAAIPDPTVGWYPWQAKGVGDDQGVLGMASWLDAPAGKSGRVKRVDDTLQINGQEIKFWGINNCYSSCAPQKDIAERRAKLYSKYGINAVRLHKYADGPGWAGIQSAESFAELDAAALDRMDYFVAKLKEAGIYVKLSPTFGIALGRADQQAVPYMSEFGSLGNGKDARIRAAHGSVWLGKELQDLQIQQMTNLLKHRNPYTGMTYAEDPAILVIEMYNEDSALFFGTMGQLQKSATLRKRASESFSNWLIAKYKDEAGLQKAWGPGALNSFGGEGFTNESLANKTIVPAGNPWFYDPDQLRTSQKPKERRLHDTMLWLYEQQNAFYTKYSQAMRSAGYAGEILASNWIAGRAFSHLYNLHSDSLFGIVDRHNYTGGPRSDLSRQGSGMFSIGMNQVLSHPYSVSEWIHTNPSEWVAEGPPIMAAYGMGLQGWDVSFIFQNGDDATFSNRVFRQEWDPMVPTILGVFPNIARQVYRNDVKESDVVAPMRVHMPSLYEGKLSFNDKAEAQGDVKEATSVEVPAEALAVARVGVEFTPTYQDTPKFDLSKYQSNGTLTSTTKQLQWTRGDKPASGFFTMDTPANKAVVGFASGKTHNLSDVAITTDSKFAVIYVTALGKNDKDLKSAKQILVTAVARAYNTGERRTPETVLVQGQGPILMEPVKATIALSGLTPRSIRLLDHDGRPTDKTLPFANGRFQIDGTRDQTCYYLLEMQ